MHHVIALAALAASTSAATTEPVRHDVAVTYSDIDLSTDAGARTMLQRIEHAAEEACSNGSHWRDPDYPFLGHGLIDMKMCREQATADAVRSLNAPLVSRDYAQSLGHKPEH